MTNRNDYNRQVIEEFRANGGKVSGPFEHTPLLLLTTTPRDAQRDNSKRAIKTSLGTRKRERNAIHRHVSI